MKETYVKCPECIDERMVRLAQTIGYLTCPNCDLQVAERPRPISLADNPTRFKTDL